MEQARGFPTDAPATDSPELEAIFKALSDSTRRRILYLLHFRARPVTEIVAHFQLTQPSISRHLGVLRNVGLVRRERDGQQVIYHLGDSRLIKAAMQYLYSVSAPPPGSERPVRARRPGW